MLRIVSVMALLGIVAAGCGGAARTQRSVDRLPPVLARAWEGQASAIAAAAASGDDCRALRLASTLRDQVVASRSKLPRRLRSPLMAGVTVLARRITCTPPANPEKPPKPPHEHKDHRPHRHGHGGGAGNDR